MPRPSCKFADPDRAVSSAPAAVRRLRPDTMSCGSEGCRDGGSTGSEEFRRPRPSKVAADDSVAPARTSDAAAPASWIERKLLVDPKMLFVGDKIGEGAHGKVYKGKYGDQIVAIKVLNRGSTPEEKATLEARFIREVNMMCKVKHENLVKFIGACKEPLMVIVSELLPGMSLKSYLHSIRPSQLDTHTAISYALDIAHAMDCLHANGIIHRDLKPGIGRTEMNGETGVISIQEGQQWHQFGLASPGGDDPGTIPRDMRAENGYGVVGRREGGPASSYWDLLRAHLSDPLTGILMDDAMILSCGHSYGSSGMQHVYRMKACGKCGLPITEASIRPNLALRLAVQAFKREEVSAKSLKRRREHLELDKCGDDDPNRTELASRGKGVQFPFAVFDRVIIKGNKRTPERFVGREAVVTAQCLNGWYVVKTSDNAESVKLQYRSLAKIADGNGPSAGLVSSNAQSSSWL